MCINFKGYFKIMRIIFTFIFTFSTYLCVAGILDSLKRLVITDQQNENKVYYLNQLSREYQSSGNYDSAIYFGNTALKLAKQMGFIDGISSSYNNIGVAYENHGKYDKALESYFSALKISENSEQWHQPSTIYNIAASNNGIANVLAAQKKYTNALAYYKKTLDMVELLERNDKMIVVLNNIGNTYMGLSETDLALSYHNKALSIAIQTADSIGVAGTLSEMSAIYFKTQEYDKAIRVLERSYSIMKGTNNKVWLGTILTNIGTILTKQKQYVLGIEKLENAVSLLKETGNIDRLRNAHLNLSGAYEDIGNYNKAFEHYKKYSNYKDSLLDKDIAKQMAEIQTKYETEKKEKEIAVQKDTINKKNFQLMSLIIGTIALVLVVMLIALVFYSRYRAKQKLLLNQIMVNEQKMRLKMIVEAQEKDRKRIAKDLHDSVGQLLFILKMNLEKTGKELDEKYFNYNANPVSEAIKILDDANAELRNIALDMVPRAIIEAGIIGAISDLLDKTKKNTGVNYTFQSFLNDTKLNHIVEIGVFRIFQEILSNIIKHSNAKEINVSIYIAENQLILIIEDNGEKFEFNINSAKANSPKEGNTGMGLLNIAIRAEALNATVLYESLSTKGTLTTIRVPI